MKQNVKIIHIYLFPKIYVMFKQECKLKQIRIDYKTLSNNIVMAEIGFAEYKDLTC